MSLSLRNKLILAIALPLLAVYSGVMAIDYRKGKVEAVAEAEQFLTALAGRLAMEIDRDLASAAQTARSTADYLTRFQPRRRETIDALLRSILETNRSIFGTAAAFEPGAFEAGRERFAPYLCRNGSGGIHSVEIEYDYARWDWYLLPKLLDRPVWTDPYFDEGAGNVLMCTYAAPFRREGKFEGTVGVDIALAELQRRLARVDARGGYCTLVSRSGTFVSHPNESYIMAETIFSLAAWHESAELAEVGREMIAGKSGVRRLIDVATGRPAWVVYVPVESVQWSLAAVIPEKAVMAEVYQRLNRQAGLLLGGLAVTVGLIVAASTWVSRPIARLAAAAHEVARGNLDVRVPDRHGRDEVGRFVTTFNQMIAELKESVESRVRETSAREAVQRELQIARQIQTSLLPMARPPFPNRKEFALDAQTAPAKIMAGDFFDFWFVADDVLALVAADVSGKGVPAAIYMAVARTVLRNFSVPENGPARVLTIANQVMAAQNEQGMFVTIFYGHYHVRTGELIFANGGHNPPFLARRDGSILFLEPATGPIVGTRPEAEYAERRETLGPGDLLLLYTDGVTEARAPDDRLLGDEGLHKILDDVHDRSVEEICREIIHRVDAYRSSPDQDDVTVLALRRAEC